MVHKRSRLSSPIEHANNNSDDSDSSGNSDYNYNESLLSKIKRAHKNDSDSEDEAIFDVASDNDDSAESNIALSDIDNNDKEDDLPDAKAWGKDKRSYYSTDFVDQDYGGHVGKDALNADFEEDEADKLQLLLAKQLKEEDFLLLDIVNKYGDEESKKRTRDIDDIVKTDIGNLTKRQQIQVLEKEAPEFFNLVNDFKEKIAFIKDIILPTKEFYEKRNLHKAETENFILIYQELLLNYCTNITLYLLLKSQRAKLQSHPVINRLLQYRELISKMNTIYQNNVAETIQKKDIHREEIDNKGRKLGKSTAAKQKHQLTKKLKIDTDNKTLNILNNYEIANRLTAFEKYVDEKDNQETKKQEVQPQSDLDEKRAITYQMKKNKGLMPTRKKEQRNPRVKHRNKFRKAQIRRKGAVREVRTEMSKYRGEISGIKASVTKSIRIK